MKERRMSRTRAIAGVLVLMVAGGVFAVRGASPAAFGRQTGGQPPIGVGQVPSPLPLSNVIRERGSSVTPAYEGWYHDKDGTVRFLVGYLNRNTKQEFDIPAGPNNRVEPGDPDQGQPTHFNAGRQWGVFTIKVPKDLGTKKMSWTIVANGFTNTISLHTRPEWIVEPYEDAAQKNTPPVLRFEAEGPSFTGPPSTIATTYTATAGEPLAVTTWVTDEGSKLNIPPPAPAGRGRGRGRGAADAEFPPPQPPLLITWTMFRGPGAVKFEPAKLPINSAQGGKVTTMATFTAPGAYILRVEGNDSSGVGGGGFQCCWTNAHVAVTVKPGPAAT
jgi:hypothetical protein